MELVKQVIKTTNVSTEFQIFSDASPKIVEYFDNRLFASWVELLTLIMTYLRCLQWMYFFARLILII